MAEPRSTDARLLEDDAAARARALEVASFIVEAPAGAGKTELLTQRYLKLLATVDAPEEIVAITFTNKAAGEMAARILDGLRRAAAGEVPEAAHKRITFDLARAALAHGEARGWGLLEHPGRLRITTIDALCAGFARQMPLLSRFGSQPRVVEDAARHYAEAARRTLVRVEDVDGGDAGELAARVAAALRHLDNDAVRLADLLAEMLARRDQWLRHALRTMAPLSRAEAEDGFALLVARELEQAARAIDARRQALLMPVARFAADNLAAPSVDASAIAALRGWTAPLATDAATLPQWRGLRELLLTGRHERRQRWTKAEGLPADKANKALKAESERHKETLAALVGELTDADVAALARVAVLPEPRYTDEEWATVEALARLLAVAAAELWTVFNAAGEVDFIEVARRALLALGDAEAPTDLALALDYRICHLLVDEFQDTSPTQVELLQRLTAGWQAGDGRTLFAVGDPMQSIYRFRKADVGLFLQVARLGIGDLGLAPLRLSRNNRSQPQVVEWINGHFGSVFPAADDVFAGAIRYRPFVATRESQGGSGVFVHALRVAKDMDDEALAVVEAGNVLEVIARARQENPEGDIAVLVRARGHLAALAAAARRAGVAFEAVDIERLDERQPVQDLLALTRALCHRADRVAWLAVLRAPWCGLTLADLLVLAGDDHQSTVWSLMQDEARLARLSDSGRRRLLHVRGVVGAAYAQRGRCRARRWIEGVWRSLGGAACLEDAGDAADAAAYLDLVDRLDAGGRFALDDLTREIEKLYAAPRAAVAAGGRLQFMTIHRAKGLEFDTVIVPGLHRRTSGDEGRLMRWEEVAFAGTDERLVAAPMRPGRKKSGNGVAGASLHGYLKVLESERGANEDVRALYVAATRARRALHWVGVAKETEKGEKDGGTALPAVGSFLRLLWPALQADFARAEPIVGDGGGAEESAAFVPQLLRLAEPLDAWVPGILRGSLPAEAALRETPPAGEQEEGGRLASDIGTLVHAYLEMMARDGLAAWPRERIDGLRDAMALWFGQQGHGAKDAASGARRAGEALQATLASVQGRWVLAAHAEAAAEFAVTSAAEGRIATHVIDRTFVAEGARWVIDYKTAKPARGLDLRRHAEGYRGQLERYATLFADEGLPIRMAILYAAVGELVELAPRA